MKEVIYNIFLMWEDDVCSEIRYATHEVEMDDDAAVKFLQSRVQADLHASKKLKLGTSFTLDEYNARMRLGQGHWLYEPLFIALGAGEQPLHVATQVVNNIPQVRFSSAIGDPDIYLREDMTDGVSMTDWLIKYANGTTIDISQLINDDYFLAIKLTFNAKLYVSSMKLLLSAIDSIAYIEYGDKKDIFEKWLTTYADISHLGITPKELWEMRNGLLHMTNLNSREVSKKKVRQVSFSVGTKDFHERDGIHYFSFYGLIKAYGAALVKWLETYNSDTEKRVDFVDRYDKTISDSRLAVHSNSGTADA
ncbi:hypothetical protein FHW96_000482 [Novosphingobium sp. SG751A]|uniref:hypothetical protein n=1 Tax=Novosphingobium sp. SG751A TaxID=2587000 RepID=UPI001555D324|nr:hypothetical protein [Novosphingobium sp. SG751A]NOW44355.1 hypothetical protein [Novosphingobium sp. SG751A]